MTLWYLAARKARTQNCSSAALDCDPRDMTTLEDKGSVEEARQAWTQMKEEIVAQASIVHIQAEVPDV